MQVPFKKNYLEFQDGNNRALSQVWSPFECKACVTAQTATHPRRNMAQGCKSRLSSWPLPACVVVEPKFFLLCLPKIEWFRSNHFRSFWNVPYLLSERIGFCWRFFNFLVCIHWHFQVTSFISFKSGNIWSSNENKTPKHTTEKSPGTDHHMVSWVLRFLSCLPSPPNCSDFFVVLYIISRALVEFSKRNREE